MNVFNELVENIDEELNSLTEMVKNEGLLGMTSEGAHNYEEILRLSEEIKEMKLLSKKIVDSYFKEKNKVVCMLNDLLTNMIKKNVINIWRLEDHDMMFLLVTKYFNSSVNDITCSISFLELFSYFLKSNRFCTDIMKWIITNEPEKILLFVKQVYLSKRQDNVLYICLNTYNFFCTNEDMCFEMIKSGVVELVVADYEYYTELNRKIADEVLIALLDGKFKNTLKRYAYDDIIKANSIDALRSKPKIHNKVLEVLSLSDTRRSFNVLRVNVY